MSTVDFFHCVGNLAMYGAIQTSGRWIVRMPDDKNDKMVVQLKLNDHIPNVFTVRVTKRFADDAPAGIQIDGGGPDGTSGSSWSIEAGTSMTFRGVSLTVVPGYDRGPLVWVEAEVQPDQLVQGAVAMRSSA